MATSSSRARRKPGGGGPRIDWREAKVYYVRLGPTRTYAEVEARFGVSETSIRKHARAEGWRETAATHDAQVERRLLDRAVRSHVERADVFQRIADEYADQLQERLLEKALDIKLSDFPGIAKTAALFAGEPTDRVSFDEMQTGFRTLLEIAARYVPKSKRPEFVAEVNEALGPSE